MRWLLRLVDWWLAPSPETPARKPGLWRFYQARALLDGTQEPGEPAPVIWTDREALVAACVREKFGGERLTPERPGQEPLDVVLYRHWDAAEHTWRYFFICRESTDREGGL